jgi:anti-sigma-K factor RskA
MSEEMKNRLLDLLADKAIVGLDEAEMRELQELEAMFPEFRGDNSFDLTAAAFDLTGLEIEQMPESLQAKLASDADQHFGFSDAVESEIQKTFEFEPTQKSSFWQWLGWPVAALATLALALNVWYTSTQKPVDKVEVPQIPSASELRQKLLVESADVVSVSWAEPVKEKAVGITGDIVWSNAKQTGYMRFRGLPRNDRAKEQYQLWIFDENQDTKTPLDGGVFDVNEDGEVIIPIKAQLKVVKPQMFAITVEKPGGVVVSKREKIMTIGKVEV